jgi:hypothetical protein
VVCRGLHVLLSIVADLEGGRPRDLGKIEDPHIPILSILG